MQERGFDIAIVGGGIVGIATAFELQNNFPELNLVVFEKEEELACHQTGRNSGVIHSGLYYKPGSFKAQNCVNGRRRLIEFAQANNVDFDICGKIVVASEFTKCVVCTFKPFFLLALQQVLFLLCLFLILSLLVDHRFDSHFLELL